MSTRASTIHAIPGIASGAESHPIVLACDERYAMPLATTVRSLVEANRSARPLQVIVLTTKFSEKTKRKVETSVAATEASFRWLNIDLSPFGNCSTLAYISKITYARLLLPYMLSESTKKALYLDADILVLDDLQALWETDLQEAVLGAVEDIDSPRHSRRLEVTAQRTTRKVPQENPSPRYAYFNAGVLLIDLERWREERISERAMEYLAQYPNTPYSDQDALNVVCSGRWKALDNRWNLQKLDHGARPGMSDSGRAAIVHFIWRNKPWDPTAFCASADFYEAYRNRTEFARTRIDRFFDAYRRRVALTKESLKRLETMYAIYGYLKEWWLKPAR